MTLPSPPADEDDGGPTVMELVGWGTIAAWVVYFVLSMVAP